MSNQEIWNGVESLLKEYKVNSPKPEQVFPPDLPLIGNVLEDEIIKITSLNEIDSERKSPEDNLIEDEDGDSKKIEDLPEHEVFDEIKDIIENSRNRGEAINGNITVVSDNDITKRVEPCAWYQPLHFYKSHWGIFIREKCVIDMMRNLTSAINWGKVKKITKYTYYDLRDISFYYYYFHEQFHHKVESFGLRLLAAKTTDSYLGYKSRVYRPNLLTDMCLEESLATAESFLRFNDGKYKRRFDSYLRRKAQDLIYNTIQMSPPGYREGSSYLSSNSYKNGINRLQSQILEGSLYPKANIKHWNTANQMTRGLRGINSEIYSIINLGSNSIFEVGFDPKFTTSTKAIIKALQKYYGFSLLHGKGKGSHQKLVNNNVSPSVVVNIPGNRSVVAPGIVNQILKKVTGSGSLNQLPKLLNGSLSSPLKI